RRTGSRLPLLPGVNIYAGADKCVQRELDFGLSGANSTDSHLASCAPPIGRLRKMSVKLAVVLLIALQASLCLCQLPEPEQELQDKYKNLKASAEKRISVAIGKFKELIHPLVEDSVVTQSAKERVEELQENPHFQSFVKIVT
ncbi:14 kDa apolipoprotein-like, partial [Arapaima gigas]